MTDLLHGFPRDDLRCIAEGLEEACERTVNVGNTTEEGDEHLESTTAAAARFIRAALGAPALAKTPASWLPDAMSLLDDIRKDVRQSKFGGLQCDDLERVLRAAAGVTVHYSFCCYSCSNEWGDTRPASDCPAPGCGTTNNYCARNPEGVAGTPAAPAEPSDAQVLAALSAACMFITPESMKGMRAALKAAAGVNPSDGGQR
jgi:hypothetical protein